MAASIMLADVMPVTAASKGNVYATGESSIFVRRYKPDNLVGIGRRDIGPGDRLVVEATHNSWLYHFEIGRNVEISWCVERRMPYFQNFPPGSFTVEPRDLR